MADAATNASEYTVSEISGAVKRTVEDAFGYVRVRGEISGFRGQHSSGHAYFAMKDEKARLEAVIWRGVYNKLKVKPEEGLEVIATGKVTTYPGSSKYQIVIESLEPAGVGALMALLDERKKKLMAEGLFDPARKQLLPYLPRVIGVVTSPTGAVIRDIMHRLDDRFPTHVLLWPVRVQGDTCGREVAQAIRGFNAFDGLSSPPRPDVLIVARGGGSLEDLWGFNDEAVVRAAADSDIPLISAVGHETDWTLIDYAADVRAPTPTGAAEMAVPVRADLVLTLEDLNNRNKGSVLRLVQSLKNQLNGLSRGLPTRETLLATTRQRLDEAAGRLPRAMSGHLRDFSGRYERAKARHSLDRLLQRFANVRQTLVAQSKFLDTALLRAADHHRSRLAHVSTRLSPLPLARSVAEQRRAIGQLFDRAGRGQATQLERRRARWQRLADNLGLVSYENVLQRGFALVRDDADKPVRSAEAIKAGASYSLQMADGRASVIGGGAPGRKITTKPVAPKGAAKAKGDQGSLF